jgi:hypothetical protein
MKKNFITLFEHLRHTWRLLVRATVRKHDPLLVYSMASFNFDGGWRELLVKASPKHMSEESTINERFAI